MTSLVFCKSWPVLFLAILVLPCAALAEGVMRPEEGVTVAPHSKPKPKPRMTAKKVAPATPTAPIPYTAYSRPNAAPLPMPANALPAAITFDPPVAIVAAPIVAAPVLPVPALPVQPIEAPPPPIAAAPVTTEISLRCETHTVRGRKTVATGTFYIDLFPSPVFPDQQADFKFLFADPAYDSLIRDTMCLDTTCSAQVSGTAYYLVNRVTKKGAALRITLDRARGGFYAEEMGKHGSDHLGEQGYCTPQPLPQALF